MIILNDKRDTGNKIICAKLAFAILLAGFVLPMVLAETCTPEAGYKYCSTYSYSYGGVTATAKIQLSDVQNFITNYQYNGTNYALYLREFYSNYKADGTKVYSVSDLSNRDCSYNGCSGSTSEISKSGKVYSNTKEILVWACAGECGNPNSLEAWAWASTSALTQFRNNAKTIDCYSNSDCASNQICDKASSDFSTWKCVGVACSGNQTKCENKTYYECSNNNWVLSGLEVGKCGVECTEDKCSSTTYYECSDNAYINRGQVNGKCGYTQTTNNQTSTNQTNQTSGGTTTGSSTESNLPLYIAIGVIVLLLAFLLFRKK